MEKRKTLIAVTFTTNGSPEPELSDIIGFAETLTEAEAYNVKVWVLGRDVETAAEKISALCAFPVEAFLIPNAPDYVCDIHGVFLAEKIKAEAPDIVCAAHTSRGGEWAPYAAAMVGAGCITGVDAVQISDGQPLFLKDLYGGKVKGRYMAEADFTVITIMPGCFRSGNESKHGKAAVTSTLFEMSSSRTVFKGIKAAKADTSGITQADILVAVGNGIGDEENIEWIHRLAGIFQRAAVAGSRIVCDRGWLTYDKLVGVTGATVNPKLYIACGISGASQHVAGMRGSGMVIAVNTDKRAPMFSEADICIQEDVVGFIQAVLEQSGANEKHE